MGGRLAKSVRRMGERVGAARGERLVGRRTELARVAASLDGLHHTRLFYVWGPGGAGKSMLAHACAELARARGRRVRWLDCRAASFEPGAFERAVDDEASDGPASLLVVDAFEHIGGQEPWFRDRVLARARADTVVLVAGRERPDTEWVADPGWRSVTELIALRDLSRDEADELMSLHGVPSDQRAALYGETGGLPLAIVLAAERSRRAPTRAPRLRDEPGLVRTLLARILRDVPSETHRRALCLSALAPEIDAELIARVVDPSRAVELYDWLWNQSFVVRHGGSVQPHGVVRAALLTELQWGQPQTHGALVARLLRALLVRASAGDDPRAAAAQLVHVLPRARLVPSDGTIEPPPVSPADPADWPELEAMTEHHEGATSVSILRAWRARGARCQVVRDDDGVAAGYFTYAPVHELSAPELAFDPAASALHDAVGLRPGQPVVLVRHWMARDAYQALSPVQTAMFHDMNGRLLDAPDDTALFGMCVRDPELWTARRFGDADPDLVSGSLCAIDGRRYGVIGRAPAELGGAVAWLLAYGWQMVRLLESAAAPAPTPLRRDEFALAVKTALRDLHHPELLRTNPLIATRVVADTAGNGCAATALAELLRTECARFRASPRDRHYFAVLERAYLSPATKQYAAARELGMGYSTFRRHLAAAARRVAEDLWRREQQTGEHKLSTSG